MYRRRTKKLSDDPLVVTGRWRIGISVESYRIYSCSLEGSFCTGLKLDGVSLNSYIIRTLECTFIDFHIAVIFLLL